MYQYFLKCCQGKAENYLSAVISFYLLNTFHIRYQIISSYWMSTLYCIYDFLLGEINKFLAICRDIG